jgi:NADH dehydrogenase [ubiquinone] 1 alpha subcomplex assembly factor 6
LNLLRDYRYDTLESLEATAESHTSSKLYLLLQSLDINNQALDHAISHLGKSIGLACTISDIFLDLKTGKVPIPPTIMYNHSLSEESLLDAHEMFAKNRPVDPQAREKLQNVIFELSTRANDHLLTSKSHLKDLLEKSSEVKDAAPVLLYMVPLEMYLKDLENSNFDLFDKKLAFGYDKKRFMLPFRLYGRARDPSSFAK